MGRSSKVDSFFKCKVKESWKLIHQYPQMFEEHVDAVPPAKSSSIKQSEHGPSSLEKGQSSLDMNGVSQLQIDSPKLILTL